VSSIKEFHLYFETKISPKHGGIFVFINPIVWQTNVSLFDKDICQKPS
jgi:hypothetical protein